jgi:hypothetical protein
MNIKLTAHLKSQIENAQGAGIDLESLELTGDEENAYLVNKSGDPVPPGTPPPVPPAHV